MGDREKPGRRERERKRGASRPLIMLRDIQQEQHKYSNEVHK